MSTYKDFFSEYLDEIQNTDAGNEWWHVRCPFHNDDKASAGINKKTGVLHCFTCDDSWSPARFLHEFAGMDDAEAYKVSSDYIVQNNLIEKRDTFVTKKPLPNPRFTRLFELSQDAIREDQIVVQEYCNSKGIHFSTLLDLGVGFLPQGETNWERNSLVFPYIHDGRVVGIRYRDQGGNKGGEENCYFTLWGIDRLDDSTVTDIIIVTEGETDCLRTHQALDGKYTVVCTPTATFRKEWDREFQGSKQVILIPQFDEPSVKMVDKARAAIQNLDVLWLPWKKRQTGKDVVDWLGYHTEDELVHLIDSMVRRGARQVMSGYEFEQEANRPRRWIIRNLISRQEIGLIGGAPKSKKTWGALNLVHSLLSGAPLFGIPIFEVEPQDVPLRIMFWEEEGAMEELYERVSKVLGGIDDWRDRTFWAHQLGMKLDSDDWIIRLGKEIEERAIDVVILDPFSRMYSVDEDSASEMGQVWGRIASLINRYPDMVVIILHHFTKSGSISDGFASLRGSGRTGAEADLGIFMEKRPDRDGGGARIHIEGRAIKTPVSADGSEVFRLTFDEDTGMLQAEGRQVLAGRGGALMQMIKDNGGEITLNDAARQLNVTPTTVHNWIKRSVDPDTDKPLMEVLHPANGKQAVIVLTKEGQK